MHIRVEQTANRAVELATAYEVQVRGSSVIDVQAGRDPRTTAFLNAHGVYMTDLASADLLSEAASGDRLIEVKGRGSFGPLTIYERQLDTMRAGGPLCWLYAAFYLTQPSPAELWLVQNPAELEWTCDKEAKVPKGQPRSASQEATFWTYLADPEDPRFEVVDLLSLVLPTWAGPNKD